MSNVPVAPVEGWSLRQHKFGRIVISYACPHCREKLTSPVEDAGKSDACPGCGAMFVLPAAAAQQAAEIARQREVEKAAREQEKARQRAARDAERRAAAERAAAEAAERERRQREQEAAQVAERQRYLAAVSDRQKKYNVILVNSVRDVEEICNRMGFEGWELEQSFVETFSYCCGAENKRQFVLIFSQPLNADRNA